LLGSVILWDFLAKHAATLQAAGDQKGPAVKDNEAGSHFLERNVKEFPSEVDFAGIRISSSDQQPRKTEPKALASGAY